MATFKKKDTSGDLSGYRFGLAEIADRANEYETTKKEIGEYVGREFGHGMKMMVLHGTESINTPKEPEYPTGSTVSEKDKAIWSKKYDMYTKELYKYNEHRAKVFGIILKQCEKTVANQVESGAKYKELEDQCDVVGLLSEIKKIAYDSNELKYPPLQAVNAWKQLLRVRQAEKGGEKEELLDYYKRFMSQVEAVERAYGTIAPVKLAEKDKKKYAKDSVGVLARERDKMLAVAFMEGADKSVYGFNLRGLSDDHALGDDRYPKTPEDVLRVLTLIQERAEENKARKAKRGLVMMHARSDVVCWKCKKKGHLKRDCPEGEDEAEEANGSSAPRGTGARIQLTQATEREGGARGMSSTYWHTGRR